MRLLFSKVKWTEKRKGKRYENTMGGARGNKEESITSKSKREREKERGRERIEMTAVRRELDGSISDVYM